MYDPLFLPTDLSLAILLCHLEAERSFCLQPYFTLSITKKLIYYQVKTIKGKKILKHLKVFKGQSALSKVKTNNRMLGCIQEFLEDKSDSLKHILIGPGVHGGWRHWVELEASMWNWLWPQNLKWSYHMLRYLVPLCHPYCPSINVILTIISDIFLVRFLKILVLLKQLWIVLLKHKAKF